MTRDQALSVAMSFTKTFVEAAMLEVESKDPIPTDAAIAQLSRALEDVPSVPLDDDLKCRCGHTAFWHAGLQLGAHCIADGCDCRRFEEVPK